jgi:hypothetical protein
MVASMSTEALLDRTFEISVRGRRCQVPAYCFGQSVIIVKGRYLSTAEIFDEYWLGASTLPDPLAVIEYLRGMSGGPDLFTFAQRAPHAEPQFKYFHGWDNVAAIPISSHDHWLQKQVSSASRRNVRSSEKKGVIVRASEYDEAYVCGIMSIFNESPFRHGRKYWHYGKDFETVRAENGTYADRSVFLGAYLGGEMIGYMKVVFDTETAAVMQILSKMKHFDKRPNNAMLSEAVRICAERGIGHLLYESFVYGKKTDSSLTRFKRENGFVRIDLPRYYVPLTTRGRIALRLGLQRPLKERVPAWLTTKLLHLREKYYELRAARA